MSPLPSTPLNPLLEPCRLWAEASALLQAILQCPGFWIRSDQGLVSLQTEGTGASLRWEAGEAILATAHARLRALPRAWSALRADAGGIRVLDASGAEVVRFIVPPRFLLQAADRWGFASLEDAPPLPASSGIKPIPEWDPREGAHPPVSLELLLDEARVRGLALAFRVPIAGGHLQGRGPLEAFRSGPTGLEAEGPGGTLRIQSQPGSRLRRVPREPGSRTPQELALWDAQGRLALRIGSGASQAQGPWLGLLQELRLAG